jgi:cleavage stimulation factor subunit 3
VRFIRKSHDPRGGEGLPEIRQAFEFTLDHVGQDVRSGPLWQDYVTFLAAPKPGSPDFNALFGAVAEGQEDAARATALRRAYHRALLVPTQALDALWSGYERLESGGSNKTLAKKMLDEWRPRYQAARTLLKERGGRVEGTESRALPAPPGRGGPRQARLAASWTAYLAWEVENPQRVEPAIYQARVGLAYEQALAALPLHPEVWLDFAAWQAEGGGLGPAAAVAVLDRGQKALPTTLALHFAAAELHEAGGDVAAARAVFEALAERVEEAGAGGSTGVTPAGTPAAGAPPPGAGTPPPSDQPADAAATGAGAATDGAVAATTPPESAAAGGTPAGTDGSEPLIEQSSGAAQLTPEQGTLVWVHYMRFARRTDGIMAARKLFMRARKWRGLRWEAFAGAAALEWGHERKEAIPRNIFELGLKTFLGEPAYVLHYVAFLKGLGDVANARALFERALTATAPAEAVPLWDAYLAFEQEVGTLQAARAVETRRRDACKELGRGQDAVRLAVLKYKFLELWPGPELHFRQLLGEGHAPPPETMHPEFEPPTTRTRERDYPREREPLREFRDVPREHRERESRGRGGPGPREPRDFRDRRDRSRSPPGRPLRPSSPEPSRHFPRELGQLMNSLPAAPDGPVPDIEQVIAVIARADLTLDGIAAHEAAAARERRRQRQVVGPPGGPPGGNGALGGAGPGPMGKRKGPEGGGAPLGGDSDSDSSDDEFGGGVDVYRMRRKQARV